MLRKGQHPGKSRLISRLSRRALLARGGALGAALGTPVIFRPLLSRAADRPAITHGIQSGDVGSDGAIIWARADRPSRMRVDFSTAEGFKEILGTAYADALPDDDLTAKVALAELPPGQEIFYRVAMENLAEPTIVGEPMVGRFRSVPADRRDVSFCWSADTCGQGWGIDPARGGLRTYATMLAHRPDFFVHSGDTIYADGPILAEIALADGTIWRNIVTEAKSKPAESLEDFRGNYRYNLLDANVRAFNAQVPILAQWDDHEVANNWSPETAGALAARAVRAFHNYMPIRPTPFQSARIYRRIGYGPLLDLFMIDMRSYRGPNGDNREAVYGPASHFLGPAQIAWLKRELQSSRALWKVIAADMPIGLYVMNDFARRSGSEAVAQGDGGPPLGREIEIADLLSFIKRRKIRNTLWITADVHYTAAHYYDPAKARFSDFDPFWEFVSGPLHAGTFGPNELDPTFGPEAVFVKAPTREQGVNLPPSAGLQFFGHVRIDGRTGALTVLLRDVADQTLFAVVMEAISSSQ
jgi:alkaline phosphatase D